MIQAADHYKATFALGPRSLRIRAHDGTDIGHIFGREVHELYQLMRPRDQPGFDYGDTLFGELKVTQAHNTPVGEQ
jgi:hypothetical protein